MMYHQALQVQQLDDGPSSAFSLFSNSISDGDVAQNDQQQQFVAAGLPPLFTMVPLDLLHTILSLIPISERRTLLQVSSRFTSVITHPAFLLSRKSNGTADEILFLVGGTYPSRTHRNTTRGGGNGSSSADSNSSSSFSFFNSTANHRVRSLMGHRDTFSRGLWGYVPSLKSWRMFGGDPRRVPNHPMQHVVDSKAVYVPHPHCQLILLGGYNNLIGEDVDRVVSYSLLTGQWNMWPSMMRARRGRDLHVQFVKPDKLVLIGCSHGKCGCSRCAGGSVYYDSMDIECSIAVNAATSSSASAKSPPRVGKRCTTNSIMRSLFDDKDIIGNGKMTGSGLGAVFDGHAEIYNLTEKSWTRKEARAPSCPPRDGGAAVLEGRYFYLPGVEQGNTSTRSKTRCDSVSSTSSGIPSAVISSALGENGDSSSESDTDDQAETSSSGSRSPIGSPVARSPPSTTISYSGCSSPALVPGLGPNSRPGLVYDVQEDIWTTLEPCRLPPTHFPTTITHQDKLLVMGGYRSGRCGDSIMSLFRDGLIVDYEEHTDKCWAFAHADRQWSRGSDCAVATNAKNGVDDAISSLPKSIPVAVRGASALVYNGRLTLLGGMTTFNQTVDNEERRVIWQYHEEEDSDDNCSCSSTASSDSSSTTSSSSRSASSSEMQPPDTVSPTASVKGWKPLYLEWEFGKATQVKLPVSALLDTYSFSAHF